MSDDYADEQRSLAESVAAALTGDEVAEVVLEVLLARLAGDELTPDERREAEALLARLGGTNQVQ